MKAKNIKNKIRISFFAALCAMSSSVLADDIQIYTGNKGDVTESNILFMVDVSGSMGWDDPTRISQVKAGLIQVLQDLPDKIKVGIGIYNGSGGSIIHPVKRLGGIAAGNVVSEIISPNDDGYELKDGNITLDTEHLPFSGTPSTKIEVSINNGNDDAEQCSDGSGFYYRNHSYLDVNEANCDEDKGSKNTIGTIFRNLSIPKNAKILNAYIEYTHNRYSVGEESDSEIVIENSTRPVRYKNSKRLISRSIYNFGNTENVGKISWLPAKGNRVDEKIQTPNIAPLIQAMVNRSDWSSTSNGVNLIVKPIINGRQGDITFYTRDNTLEKSAKLIVEFSGSTSGAAVSESDKNTVALRFHQLMVPSNISMTKGTLEVAAHDNVTNGGSITVKIAKLKDSGILQETINNITERKTLGEKTFSFNTWRTGEVYKMDVKSLYEKLFNTKSWCAGDDLVLILESDSLGGIKSSEASSFQAPKVTVSFDSASEDSCGQVVNYYDVDNYSNDGYVNHSNTDYITQNYLLIGGNNTAAVRFNTVSLSNEDVIEEAYIRFSSVYNYTGDIPLRVTADISNFNNPKEYINSSGNKISDRISGSIFPVDTVVGELDNNGNFRTGDISSIINKVIKRGDWNNGNSISLLLKGLNGNYRYAFSNDYSVSESPRLYLKIKKRGEMTSGSVRSKLIELVQGLKVENGTPTLGSSFEAYQYFTGKDVIYGKKRYDRYKRVSDPLTWSGGILNTPAGCNLDNYNSYECESESVTGNPKYITPITNAVCETNNMIMITDGYPTDQSSHILPDGTSLKRTVESTMGQNCGDNWDCLFKFTRFMAENDLMPNVDGIQNVNTNVIGFGNFDSKTDMEQYASAGLGSFYPVTDVSSLSTALEIIVNSIIEVETTIATPGVSVNQNNKFQFLNELYYSVFKPSKLKGWKGNLKKYKIKASNSNGTSFDIIDRNGAVAIDQASGFFKETSQSYWSDVVDGKDVTVGGATEQFTNNRNLFTYTESGNISNIDLNNNNHKLDKINTQLTQAHFNIAEEWSDSEFDDFLDWVGGKDIKDEDKDGSTTDSRNLMGDPLHSQPIVINYTENDSTIFVSTNEGFLHGINANNGEELFAFAPKELLPKIYDRYRDKVGNHIYGLDSSWIAYRHDDDNSGSVTDHSNDFMYLYGGMRRGGKSIFALDVSETYASNLSSNIAPKLKYVINSDKHNAFTNIGETWSVPVLSRVMYAGQERIVMIFGGGYDTSNDDHTKLTASDVLGRQIYMVDAKTGQLLWWASGTDTSANTKLAGMNYSITSKLSILDLNGDGYLDYIYAADMGGQILKFRVNQDNTGSSNFAEGKIFAKLGKTDPKSGSDISNNRKFYERVTVVPVLTDTEKFLAVIAGSGHRASPLSFNVEDALFVLKDKEILEDKLVKTKFLDKEDLSDITYDIDENSVVEDIASKEGYVIWLKEGVEDSAVFLGEKAMGEPVAFNNSIIFTTYFPQSEPKSCSPVVGNSRSYRIDLMTGMPHESNEEDEEDETPNQKRYVEQALPGLAAGTKIIYTNEGVIALTNTSAEGFGLTSGLGLFRSSWYPKHEKEVAVDTKLVPPHLR